jgi:hypothetical protein
MMRPSLDKVVLLAIVLVQAIAALGAGQRVVFVSHHASCADHVHAGDERVEAQGVARRCSDAPAHAAAVVDCCPCPHVHLRLLDEPLTRGETRNGSVREALPVVGRPVYVAIGDESSGRNGLLTRWSVRDLATGQPPPDGLRTTVLVI